MQIPAAHAFGHKLPAADLLIYLAGDFWRRLFTDQAQLYALVSGTRQEYRQTIRELHEAAAAGSFQTTPAYHTETYWPLLVDPDTLVPSPIRYGDGLLYGQAATAYYGDLREDFWELPIPESLRDAAGVTDRIVGGSTWLGEGYDAVFHNDRLQLSLDPRTRFEEIVDQYGRRRLLLWLYMARFDRRTMADRYGVLLDAFQRSEPVYMQTVQNALTAQVQGGSELSLRKFLAGLVDEPVAESGETVVTLLTDQNRPVVITDRRTLYGRSGSAPTVAVGDKLQAGDLLFDTVRFTAFESDDWPIWLESVTFPTAMTGLPSKTLSPGDLPPTLRSRDDGSYYLSFDADLAFWDWADRDGALLSYVLASRGLPAGITEMTASQLPTQLDILRLLGQLKLRYTVSLSQFRADAIDASGKALLKLVREVHPPWVTHLVQFDEPAGTVDGCQQPSNLF